MTNRKHIITLTNDKKLKLIANIQVTYISSTAANSQPIEPRNWEDRGQRTEHRTHCTRERPHGARPLPLPPVSAKSNPQSIRETHQTYNKTQISPKCSKKKKNPIFTLKTVAKLILSSSNQTFPKGPHNLRLILKELTEKQQKSHFLP